MLEDEGRRSVGLEFGGLEQVREDCRESRGTMWVASILQDIRFGLRQFKSNPSVTFVAVLSLALLRVTLDCLCNWMAMYGPKRRLRRTSRSGVPCTASVHRCVCFEIKDDAGTGFWFYRYSRWLWHACQNRHE